MAGEPPIDVPVLPPAEALEFFRRKGFKIGFAWQDVWQAEHARAFTVAKVMSLDLLADIRAAVDTAIAEGQTLEMFSAALRPTLEAKGWWGRKRMIDPLTMEAKVVQLGSPHRLKTIFQVNSRVAYETGKWERIRRTQATFPFLRYTSVMDGRERPQHHAWNGTVLPVDDPWWDTHAPPCGWNCRCTVVSLNQRMLDRRGQSVTEEPVAFPSRPYLNKRTGEVSHVEEGIDPGWSYHVGRAPLEGVSPRPIGPGGGGEDVAANSQRAPDPVRRLRDAFGLQADGVWIDAAGWPIAVSAAWLADLSAGDQDAGVAAVEAIVEPVAIRLVWVRDKAGRSNLFRRYVGREWMVDVGSIGWRWRRGTVGDARSGTALFAADVDLG